MLILKLIQMLIQQRIRTLILVRIILKLIETILINNSSITVLTTNITVRDSSNPSYEPWQISEETQSHHDHNSYNRNYGSLNSRVTIVSTRQVNTIILENDEHGRYCQQLARVNVSVLRDFKV